MKRRHDATGIYVYCIAEGEPFAATAGLHPCRPVHSIAHEDLLAVVSEVSLQEFGAEGLHARLEDDCWLEQEVRAHERVIEKVMEDRTVLPMKFCTIFRTEGRVRDLLGTRREKFRNALARLRGLEEWELKMYQELAPAVGTQVAKPLTRVSGRAYLMQKREARLAAQDAAAEARRQAQRAFTTLKGCVEDIRLKPVAPAHSLEAAKLILDAVCLLAKPQVPLLRQQFQDLGNQLTHKRIRFQLSGPWPPYHFSGQAQ